MENGRKSSPVKTMRDVRHPRNSRPFTGRTAPTELPKAQFAFRLDLFPDFFRRFTGRKNLRLSGTLLAGGITVYLIYLGFFADRALNALQSARAQLPELRESAENLDTGGVVARLDSIYGSVRQITGEARTYGVTALSSALGEILPGFGEIPDLLSNAGTLNEKTLAIARDLDLLKTEGIGMLTSQRGGELISALDRVRQNVSDVVRTTNSLAAQSDRLGSATGRLASVAEAFSEKYLPVSAELVKTRDFLDSLVSLLKQSGDQHILLIFQNPTEIRPAGGFIGSFGDLTLNGGNLKEIKIDDIYNADRQLNLKLLPPKELSGITPTWGARDANWFFDFPTSAKKVADLLQESDLYKSKGIAFQGAIAINTDVLQSVLAVVGPIELPKYRLTITPENFLKELQREVEEGQDKIPGQNPKRILSALAPLLMEKLRDLSAAQKNDLVSRLKNHLERKDIMLYFRDWRMENFFESLGIAGDVLQLPDDFTGDYLAVVDANIASGKTDAVISQNIALKSAIDSDGTVINELSVTRSHDGTGESDWWYRVANRNYLKILVPENSDLLSVKGNNAPPAYGERRNSGLSYDLDLAAVEKSASLINAFNTFVGRESGKTSFGAWMTTQPGGSKTVTMQYESGIRLNVHDALHYQFVFEKQSGVESALEYSIAAPPGYIWKESGRNIYEYGTQQLKAREVLDLTLVKSENM